MAKLIVFSRGGAAGKVAINADLVTDVRSAGAFTDIFCGGRQIAVDGSFEQVVSILSGGGLHMPLENGRSTGREHAPGRSPGGPFDSRQTHR
jgi:hypothetical protein